MTLGEQSEAVQRLPIPGAEQQVPDRRRRDIDNVGKALLDALQHAGCFDDDEQIDVLHIERRTVIKGGACRVVVTHA